MARTADKSKVDILLSPFPEDFLFRTPDRKSNDLTTLLTFSLAVWRTRAGFYRRLLRASFIDSAAYSITTNFLSIQALAAPKRKRRRDRQGERAKFDAMFAALPPDSLSIFTDGSAFKAKAPLTDSGSAGAGVYVIDGRNTGAERHSFASFSLGCGTNNYAELVGILRALQHLLFLARRPGGLPPVVRIFTDNQFAINTSLGKWKTSCHSDILQGILACRAELQGFSQVLLLWVPAHAGVYGNEVADYLAKRGASGISAINPPPDNFLMDAATPTSPEPELEFADEMSPLELGLVNDEETPPIVAADLKLSNSSRISVKYSRRSKRKLPEPTLKSLLYPGIDFSQYDCIKRRRVTPSRRSINLPSRSLEETKIDLLAINLPEGEIDDLMMTENLDDLVFGEDMVFYGASLDDV
jgi:ribonuclease HI